MKELSISRRDKIKKISCAIKSQDRTVRRAALEELKYLLIEWCDLPSEWCDNPEIFELFAEVKVGVLTSLEDTVEKCRELSAEILKLIIHIIPEIDLAPIIATLVYRLTSPDEAEPSEEVRLLEVRALRTIIENCAETSLFRFLDELTHILAKTIVDPSPDVKRESCCCASALAENVRSKFHMVSETLVTPLLHTISHRHSKTRETCIYSIGSVILHGNSKSVEDVVSHFAQRMFDHSPSVRIAVVDVIGKWLLDLPDRYSFFHRLVPLLLSALSDQVEEVRNKAKTLWARVGEQYLEENEKDFKSQIDFPEPAPSDYPHKDGQPNLGCRALVQRNLCSILPALLRDMQDWVGETRVKSSKLLYFLLLHAEKNATSNLPKFIQGIVTAAKDEETEAVQAAIETAELLGYFIEPSLWCKSFLPTVHDSPTSVHLSVLAGIIRGCGKKPLNECYESVCTVLADPLVCRLTKNDEQAYLLLCIEAVLLLPDKIDSNTNQMLFNALTSVSALSSVDSIIEEERVLFDHLAKAECLESTKNLFDLHTMPLLKEVTLNHELWTPLSPEVAILSFLIESCDKMEDIADFVIPALIENLELQKDARLRSTMLTVVAVMLKKLPDTEEFSANTFSLMRDGLFPNLTWQAGKVAAALRTIAIACLWEVIHDKKFSHDMMSAIGDELLSKLVPLIDEEALNNRLLVCKIMEYILPALVCSIDQHKIHNLIIEFLKLMDDLKDEVRLWTVKVFKAYFKAFNPEFNWNSYRAHVNEIYKNMLVHMDDNKDYIREAVLDLLKGVAFACPDILLQECESVRPIFRSGYSCEELIDHIKHLQISD